MKALTPKQERPATKGGGGPNRKSRPLGLDHFRRSEIKFSLSDLLLLHGLRGSNS